MLSLWLLVGLVGLVHTEPQQRTRQGEAAPVAMPDVFAAQVALDRLGFSPGEIDGRLGPNVQRAVEAFQRAHNLPVSGQLDEITTQELTSRSAGQPPLTSYEITDADVKGPYSPQIPRDLVAQSKLQALHYRGPLEAVAEKFHVNPRTLQALNPEATFTRAGEQVQVPDVPIVDLFNKPPTGQAAPVTIVVTAQTSALTVEGADGKILFHAPVSSGSEHDPLPLGNWRVTAVQHMPAFHYNPDLFWDANPAHSKARIAPGPNNPVGIAWIDLSKEHYGIHGTPEPSNIGHTQSHGCVRLTNWDVRRVLEWARAGTPVVFR